MGYSMKISNAKIISTFIGREDHDIPTAMIQVEHSGGSIVQGFGGLDLRHESTRTFIQDVIDAVGVKCWEDLPGTYIRVEHDGPALAAGSRIIAIGHIVEDKWKYLF